MTKIGQLHWLALTAIAMSFPVSAQTIQDLASITQAAEEFIATEAAAAVSGEVQVTAGRLDQRLQMPACSLALQRFLPPGGRLLGDTTVGIRCDSPQPWTLYVPVKVTVYGQVLVVTRALARDAIVGTADLALERRDLGSLYGGYLSDPAQAVGMVLRRSLAPGAALEPAALAPQELVRRGQRVMLVSRGAGIEVRAEGEALADGARGEWIQVRNATSKRVVEGTVVEPGVVQVPL